MLNSSITQHHHHGNVYTPKTRTTLEQRDSSPDMALRQFTSRPGFEIPDEVDRDEVDGDEPGTTIGEPYDDVLRSHSRPHTIAAPPRYPRYADPEIRKKTFASWANPFPSIELLIASGFFFLGGRDSVQCFQCGIILHSWEENDTPDEEHVKYNQTCSFIQKKRQSPRENGVQSVAQAQHQVPPDVVIKKVARLGHQESLIIKAFGELQLSGETNITTHKLLDAVYSLEDEEFRNAQREAAMLVVSDEDEVEDVSSQGAHGGVAPTSSPARPMEGHSVLQSLEEQDTKNPSFINDARLKELEEENENLRQRTMCRVCDDRLATELFLPCGHLACCDQCTGKLELCPFCRKKIQRTYHVFMP